MSVAEFTKHHAVIAHQDGGLGPRLVTAFRRIAAWWVERSAIRQLSYYPDALLKDMGLSRGEIPDLVRHGRPENLKIHRDVIERH